MLSTYANFEKKYRRIISNACKLLKPNHLAVFVIGNVRDTAKGVMHDLHGDTKAAFKAAGCTLYNDATLNTSIGTAAMRASHTMGPASKLVTIHQNVTVFVKGGAFNTALAKEIGVRSDFDEEQASRP